MANLDAPKGFQLVQGEGVNAYNGKMQAVVFAAAQADATFVGSLVKYTGSQLYVDNYGWCPAVELADPADTQLAGAVVNFEYEASDFETRYRKASTLKVAFIPADASAVYEVQEDSDGGSIDPLTNTGNNVDFTAEAGDTQTGLSTMQLDSSTAANTAALPIRLIQYVSRADNEGGAASTNAKWLVKINQSAYTNTTGVN